MRKRGGKQMQEVMKKPDRWLYRTQKKDYFDDVVSFEVDEVQKKVSDGGYTSYVFEVFDKSLLNYKIIIQMYGVTLENTAKGELSVAYDGQNPKEAADKLLRCVMELFDLGFKFDN